MAGEGQFAILTGANSVAISIGPKIAICQNEP
jgi:hypothetical protein